MAPCSVRQFRLNSSPRITLAGGEDVAIERPPLSLHVPDHSARKVVPSTVVRFGPAAAPSTDFAAGHVGYTTFAGDCRWTAKGRARIFRWPGCHTTGKTALAPCSRLFTLRSAAGKSKPGLASRRRLCVLRPSPTRSASRLALLYKYHKALIKLSRSVFPLAINESSDPDFL